MTNDNVKKLVTGGLLLVALTLMTATPPVHAGSTASSPLTTLVQSDASGNLLVKPYFWILGPVGSSGGPGEIVSDVQINVSTSGTIGIQQNKSRQDPSVVRALD